jgi:gamma-glutamylcyclotransferase (GGCT)/AIG2-like uncharacterized protein YtfP
VAVAIFTYGTLAFPRVFQAVTGRTFVSDVAWLSGHERFCVRGESYPGVLETGRGAVRGRVYCDVDPETVAVLDRFEGSLYERRSVTVTLMDGRACAAECWVVPEESSHELERVPWDPVLFARRDLRAFLAACRAFRSGRRASAATPAKGA